MKHILALICTAALVSAPAWSQTVWAQRSGPSSNHKWSYTVTPNGKLVFNTVSPGNFQLIIIKPQTGSYKFRECARMCKIEAVINNRSETLMADPYDADDKFVLIDLNRNQQNSILDSANSNGVFLIKAPYTGSTPNVIRATLGDSKIGYGGNQKGSTEMPSK